MTAAMRISKPSECILAFGIPTTEVEFRADRRRGDKDFARRFPNWLRYESEFVNPFGTIQPALRGLGVRIVRQVTLERLGELMNTAEVFILFSHWIDQRIELSDGLWDVSDIVAAIPKGYCKILDLCVCRSEELAGAVRINRPGCLVRFVPGKGKVIPSYWLFFFLVLFKHLNTRPMSYVEAHEAVIREFLSSCKKTV